MGNANKKLWQPAKWFNVIKQVFHHIDSGT